MLVVPPLRWLSGQDASEGPGYCSIFIGRAASNADVTFGFWKRFTLAMLYIDIVFDKKLASQFRTRGCVVRKLTENKVCVRLNDGHPIDHGELPKE